jgi:hypothetical protein
VASLIVERSRGVFSSRPPASDNDCSVSVDADVVLVAVCLIPVALAGPERSQDLLGGVHLTTCSRRYGLALGFSRHTVRRLGLLVFRLLAQLAQYTAGEEDIALPWRILGEERYFVPLLL